MMHCRTSRKPMLLEMDSHASINELRKLNPESLLLWLSSWRVVAVRVAWVYLHRQEVQLPPTTTAWLLPSYALSHARQRQARLPLVRVMCPPLIAEPRLNSRAHLCLLSLVVSRTHSARKMTGGHFQMFETENRTRRNYARWLFFSRWLFC